MTDGNEHSIDLATTLGWVANTRDAVRATGDDVVDFLQGQLSQDVKTLAAGQSAWSLLLQPQGKISSYLRVTRLGDAEYILDVDAGHAEPMLTRLNRFKLRTKCDLEPLDWTSISVRGPGAASVGHEGAVVAALVHWGAIEGIDLLGPTPSVTGDIAVATEAAFDLARIRGGIPALGAELTEDTIPAAAGIVDDAVSFTKGCYTGQELVARIDSRGGNVPQRLVDLVVAEGVPPVGAALIAGEKTVGRVTSVGPVGAGSHALAYLARSVATPATVEIHDEGASWSGQASALLPSATS